MARETKNETNPVVQTFLDGAPPGQSSIFDVHELCFVTNDCVQEIGIIIASSSEPGLKSEVRYSRGHKHACASYISLVKYSEI
jgi:hypothetical protein